MSGPVVLSSNTVDGLPIDIWLKVFEEVALGGQGLPVGGSEVTNLLRVCRDWKVYIYIITELWQSLISAQVMATPLTYKNIFISRRTSIDRLTHILLQAQVGEDNPGRWTQSLSIQLPDSHIGNIATLLLSMPNLRSYSILGPWISCAELSLLQNRYTNTLQSLICSVPSARADPSNGPIATLPVYGTFALMRNFQSLRTLSVNVCGLSDYRLTDTSANPITLELPSTHSFEFGGHNPGSFGILGWCRFPNVRHFSILPVNSSDPTGLSMLKSFFFNHPLISKAKLTIPTPWLENLFSEKIVLAPSIELGDARGANIPSIGVFPSSMHVLTLHVEVTPSRLYPDAIPKQTFTWECGRLSPSHASFVGSLVSHSFMLRARRIKVFDERGNMLQLN
jgi:hypothetical protein